MTDRPMKIIHVCQPDETIVGITRWRDRVLIATTARLYEWNSDEETLQVVRYVGQREFDKAALETFARNYTGF